MNDSLLMESIRCAGLQAVIVDHSMLQQKPRGTWADRTRLGIAIGYLLVTSHM